MLLLYCPMKFFLLWRLRRRPWCFSALTCISADVCNRWRLSVLTSFIVDVFRRWHLWVFMFGCIVVTFDICHHSPGVHVLSMFTFSWEASTLTLRFLSFNACQRWLLSRLTFVSVYVYLRFEIFPPVWGQLKHNWIKNYTIYSL